MGCVFAARTYSPLRIRDDLGGAEYGGQKFHDDAAVHNPQKHRRTAENERQQSIGRGRLEAGEHEPDGGDQSDQQMNAIQQFQHVRRHQPLK